MVLLQPDRFVPLVAGIERKKRERDYDVPGVGRTTLDRHRVFVMPLVGETRAATKDAREGLVATGHPTRHIDYASLENHKRQFAHG